MGIRDVRQGPLPQTNPSTSSNRVLDPKVIDWSALEQQEEKIHGREKHDNSEGGIPSNRLQTDFLRSTLKTRGTNQILT
jgi:hypothetical protein